MSAHHPIIAVITQIGLMTTWILSLAMALVTYRNLVGRRTVGKFWIAFNVSVGFWSFFWCAGAFYFHSEWARWFSIYVASACAIVMPPLFLCFVTSFLERPLSSALIRLAWLISLIILLAALAYPYAFFLPGISGLLPQGGIILWVFFIQYVSLMTTAVGLVIRDFQAADRARRNKMIYLLAGFAIGSSGGVHAFLPPLGITSSYPYGVILVPIYSIMVTYAITHHRLMDISIVIRKTIVYSAAVSVLTIIYFGSVAIFASIFEATYGSQTGLSSAIAAGLVAVCFQPLRNRIQAFVDQKFFRHHVNRQERLYELSRDVITHTSPESMGQALTRVVEEALHPKGGALYLRSRDGFGFTQISPWGKSSLPVRMEDNNPLTSYFKDHPQPFVQDTPEDVGASRDTRKILPKERAS
jgi:hypothetical protein